MAWDSVEGALAKLKESQPNHWGNYLGFYSSWLKGYFREPWAMMLPLDDHGFHRGDGVFEAARIHNKAYIDLNAHLERLERSADAIGMTLPHSLEQIKEICLELARRAAPDQALLRLFVTRGPGGFSPSPAEVVGSQLYVVLTTMRAPEPKFYTQGCKAMMSSVRAKDAFWSQIKSCNYLQNVMMKKECLEKGFDFAISLDETGRLCEGSTENLLLVTNKGEVLVPRFDYTLRGTTVREVMKIAEGLVTQGEVQSVRLADVRQEDLMNAKEAAFVGTTLGVLPIASVDHRPIGKGAAGPITTFLHQQLMARMASDPSLRTEYKK